MITITQTTWKTSFAEWYTSKVKGIYSIDEDYELLKNNKNG